MSQYLVIDDNTLVRAAVARLIALKIPPRGMVQQANSLELALIKIQSNAFDGVVTDYHLGGDQTSVPIISKCIEMRIPCILHTSPPTFIEVAGLVATIHKPDTSQIWAKLHELIALKRNQSGRA